jgi:predicted patatin/cPLA2 family phospholipase
MDRDIAIICLGGFAQGTFGAGVLSAMQDKRFRSRICAVYGASSGALNAAAFVSGTIDKAQRVYGEEVLYGKTVRPWRFLWSDVLDLETLFDNAVMPSLHLGRIRSSRIDCKVLLLRTDRNAAQYSSIRLNTRKRLKAAVAVPPYYSKAIRIGRHEYIDGAVVDVIGLEQVLHECRGKRIVLICNEPLDRGIWQRFKDVSEAGIFLFTYPHISYKVLRKLALYRKHVNSLRSRGNAHFVSPSTDDAISIFTLGNTRSKMLFLQGRKQGGALVKDLLQA